MILFYEKDGFLLFLIFFFDIVVYEVKGVVEVVEKCVFVYCVLCYEFSLVF